MKERISKKGALVCGGSTSIRLEIRLVEEAAKLLGTKSRTEAVHMALREIVALQRAKKRPTRR